MKKYILFFLFALTANQITGQDLSGAKICINPGHGGHDADDRHVPETGFWESESNLTKGLHLRDLLNNMGAEVVMTRTTNTSEDDLPLSVITEIANTNNVDYFHSIHSNAYDGKTNYPLLLFRGYDDDPVYEAAKDMGSIMWNQLNDHGRHVWKNDWENVRGDWDYYDWGTEGLGVLRGLQMPGTLSEGSFHDYIPESWRLMNRDYRKFEAWLMARSFISYNTSDSLNFGLVNGIVRDEHATVKDYYYIDGSDDGKKPVNNITVKLKNTNHVYHGDTLNNGFFLMDSVEAGNYTIIYNAEKYMKDSLEIDVTNGEITRADIYLRKDTTLSPKVVTFSPNTSDSVMINTAIKATFSFPMDTASFTEAFICEPEASFRYEWSENLKTVTVHPLNPYKKATKYTISIDTSAKSKYGNHLKEKLQFDFVTNTKNPLNSPEIYSENKAEIVPYPNPAKNTLSFDLPETHRNDVILKIYNSTGKTIINKKLQKKSKRFTWKIPDNLPDGMYFYKITALKNSDKSKIYTGKFMINR